MRRIALLLLCALVSACASSDGVTMQRDDGGTMIALRLSSNVVGEPQTVHVEVERAGRYVEGRDVTLRWSMDGMPMESQPVRLHHVALGAYEARGQVFSMSGTWHATVRLRDQHDDPHAATFTVTVLDK